MKIKRPLRQASALLIMLWAIGLLSIAVLGLAVYLQSGLEEDAVRSKLFRARQLAESGVAIALHPQVKKSDPLLKSEVAPGQSFEVKIHSEGARFNPNAIAAGEDRELFLDIFIRWGLNLDQAESLTDAILDWIDDDELKRLQGVEKPDYTNSGKPQYPRDKPLESIEEMAEIAGMDQLDSVKPDWREYFTVWSQGKIDVNEANSEILEIVTGADPAAVESLVRTRLGVDGVQDTEDDVRFKDLDQVQSVLGMSKIDFDRISRRLGVNDPLERIESTGRVGNLTKRITAIATKGEDGSQILTWIEP